MLYFTLSIIPNNSLYKFLSKPDIKDDQFHIRNNGEVHMFLCDADVELTNELKLYLTYFSSTVDKNISHSLKSFSNLPIKEV